MSKYGNKKVVVDGITFDSKKEAQRYVELKLLEKSGQISHLELQKEFELIPAQYEMVYHEIKGKTKTEYGYKRGKCLERACKYKADFYYHENGQWIAEDVKGFKTKDYIIKRKLLLWKYGIKIREV